MAEKNGQNIRRIDSLITSTADTEGPIKTRVDGLFPFVSGIGSPNLIPFLLREDIHCSWSIDPKKTSRDAVRKILGTAFRRATYRDFVEFSSHGDLHTTYAEALKEAADQVEDGSGKFYVQSDRISKTPIGERTVERFIFEGDSKERLTFVPQAQHEAQKYQKNSPRDIEKQARKFAVDPQYGFGFAMMFLIYAGQPADKVLFNKDWQQKNSQNIKGGIIRPGNPQAQYIYQRVRSRLITIRNGNEEPSYDPKLYKEALEIMKEARLETSSDGIRYKEELQKQYPFIVLAGAVEIAEMTAGKNFHDPRRYDWIHSNWDGIATTIVKTAYLKEDK